MTSNTSYTTFLNGEAVEGSEKSKKSSAVTFADELAGENPDALIEVRTQAGNQVHVIDPTRGARGFKPWTRVQEHDGIEVEVPEGYVVSYTRKRVGAVVARSEAKDGLLVITEAGDSFEAANTVEARLITNRLADERATRVAAEREAAKAEKAEAKAKRDADRAEAKRLADEEKAEKARLKAEAKAEKEAQAAAEAEAEVSTEDEPTEG